MYKSGRGPFIAVVLLLVLPVATVLWLLQQRWLKQNAPAAPIQTITPSTPNVAPSPISGPSGVPQESPSLQPTDNLNSPTPEASDFSPALAGYIGKLDLLIPVQGVTPEQLRDTFGDARSEGRAHDAIDIPAPLGTPVVAAADGEIVRLFESELGGITIYQLSTDKKLLYYYAHLQRYADHIFSGQAVHKGETIAFVGDTGNVGAGNYHLHFSVAIIPDPKRYWEGENINPYPLLHR